MTTWMRDASSTLHVPAATARGYTVECPRLQVTGKTQASRDPCPHQANHTGWQWPCQGHMPYALHRLVLLWSRRDRLPYEVAVTRRPFKKPPPHSLYIQPSSTHRIQFICPDGYPSLIPLYPML
ncbi:hypothetical protein GSI_12920 [Ganoderma sinense ZZ0214-1]|uniref:Uncharacterized protein n=1 Tax=Ganoderma sinense ZZ0214-1 TaxID=1077348 RepID=A0A2G8RU38_9APHY|nr:hypothetical protein GSI_12920 [Ganoderma sinense ZZ0214-1]